MVCAGNDILSEKEWIDRFGQRIQSPGDLAVGLCLSEGYYTREVPPGATVHPQWVNDDVMSPILKHFMFSFTSEFPLQGYEGEGLKRPSKFTGETFRGRHRGVGDVRVDLARRRLYLTSTTKDFSSGIQKVTSEIIYRGDLNRLWARSIVMVPGQDGEGYEQCWQIDTSKALPTPLAKASLNPFHRGRLDGKNFKIPGSTGEEAAQRYSFFPSNQKRVDLYVNDKHEPAYFRVDDLVSGVSAGVRAEGWHTAPIEDQWFEVGQDWSCHQELADHYIDQLSTWDLIQVFLPT